MTPRLTPLALSVVSLAACGFVLGVFSGRPELVVAVVPLVLGLFRRARSLASGEWRIARALSADQAFEGERVVVTITVTAGGPVPMLELFEPLPPSLRLVAGSNHGFFTLARDREVGCGGTYLPPAMARSIAFAGPAFAQSPLAKLTSREMEILRLLSAGKSLAEIAWMVQSSYKTVANTSSIMRQKLGVRTAAELVRLAIENRVA